MVANGGGFKRQMRMDGGRIGRINEEEIIV